MVTIVEVSDYEVSHSLMVCNQEEAETVELQCSDGKSVFVSSGLLRQLSDIFKEVLGCTEFGGGIPVKEEASEWVAFIRLLEEHKAGTYNIDVASIVNTVIMADKYYFEAIMLVCDEYLAASPNVHFSTSPESYDWVFAWLVFADRYSLVRTRDRCLKFIQLNTPSIDFEADEVMQCLKGLGMEVTLTLLQFIVSRLKDVDAECKGVQDACSREGMELHYIPVLRQHVLNRKRQA
eukprot:TRINITY_DN1002_c0_g1_i9.p2 TRINITY_DN1002_c0_g1~~TRINITY_DN1002_c0_g1_i9.p2  ORF type:complete len:245 (+),score=42.41 TRINITY_DN1002_c0_g1_i9:31-735(+)